MWIPFHWKQCTSLYRGINFIEMHHKGEKKENHIKSTGHNDWSRAWRSYSRIIFCLFFIRLFIIWNFWIRGFYFIFSSSRILIKLSLSLQSKKCSCERKEQQHDSAGWRKGSDLRNMSSRLFLSGSIFNSWSNWAAWLASSAALGPPLRIRDQLKNKTWKAYPEFMNAPEMIKSYCWTTLFSPLHLAQTFNFCAQGLQTMV